VIEETLLFGSYLFGISEGSFERLSNHSSEESSKATLKVLW